MAEQDTTTNDDTQNTDATQTKAHEDTVSYDRFQQVNQQAKEAKTRADALAKSLDDLKAQIDEREQAGLPELDRERKRAEQLEKRAAEAEQRAQNSEQKFERTRREQLVTAAAARLNFVNPARAHRLIDDIDSIDDADGAERAAKRLAKTDPYVVKATEDQPRIGKVLDDGREVQRGQVKAFNQDDAETVSGALKDFIAGRS